MGYATISPQVCALLYVYISILIFLFRELAKYKIVFKSKMGKNVEGDMVRFHEEAESFKASLWYLAAINATDTNEELLAYQRAIEMLRVWTGTLLLT